MGLSADLRWVDGVWVDGQVEGNHELAISIHDSDIAGVSFTPAQPGHGLFYLGFEPADYFGDLDADERIDHDGEAEAFAIWARTATGREVSAADVRLLMAKPGGDAPEDVFVEETVSRLLRLVGLEMPDIP